MKSTCWIVILMLCVVPALVGCDGSNTDRPPEVTGVTKVDQTWPPVPAEPVQSPVRVVFLGDSLTAGLGLSADEAFPAMVGQRLENEGLPVRVVNAGVSGDTSAGGVRRLDWLLRQNPDIIVVALGANDGLRGLEPDATEENLRRIVSRSRDAGAAVLLLGMHIPPNYGPEYTARFSDIFPRIAREMNVPLMPFLLEGVGGDPNLNQPDGIHPNFEGHRRMAANVLPHLTPLVTEAMVKRAMPTAGRGPK